MRMKLMNIENVEKFFEVVDSCKNKVELVSKEGDVLNLKSKLTQYFSLAKVFNNNQIIKELEIVTYNPDDSCKIINFMKECNK